MALAAGDQVAVAVPVGDTAYEERNGDFVFGTVDAVSGADTDVIWANGFHSEAIVATSALDKIVPIANSGIAGKKVKFGANNTAEYYGIVLRRYSRQLNGAGADPVVFVLVQLLNAPVKLEVLALAVSVVN